MISSIGIDIVNTGRFRQDLKDFASIRERIFTTKESEYCDQMANPPIHYAARFAAKEAVIKALSGLSQSSIRVPLTDIMIEHDHRGIPKVILRNKALELFTQYPRMNILLSLSHETNMAIAMVIIET